MNRIPEFPQMYLEYLAQSRRAFSMAQLWLGGSAGAGGGTGGPPGGFIGQLPQGQVTYDTTEASTTSGSASLVDNLNHIRYRLDHVVASSGVSGSGSDGRMAFWTGGSTLGSSALLNWSTSGSRIVVGDVNGVPTATVAKIVINGADIAAGFGAVVYESGVGLSPFYVGWHVGGTSGSPSATVSGSILVALTGAGYGSTTWAQTAARIRAEATENWTDTARGTLLRFSTTGSGSTTLSDSLIVAPEGLTIAAGLNIGSATGAGTGQLRQSAGTQIWNSLTLTAGATGTLPVGTGATNRVAYWSGTNTLTSGSNLTFDGNQLALATTGSNGGLLVGGDVKLYRSAAGIWRTPDSLTIDSNLLVSGSLTNSALTSGRVTYAGASGLLKDSTGLTFDGTDLTTTGAFTASAAINAGTGGSTDGITIQANMQDGSIALRNGHANTLVFINIRPSSGNNGWLTYTESGVADRWAIGIVNGDSKLHFRSTTGTGTTRMTLDTSGNLAPTGNIDLTGKMTTYGNIATVGQGIAPILAAVDATAQGAAIGTTTLYAVPAATGGLYRVNWYAKVTRAGTTSTLGALTIAFTDNTDSVAQSVTAMGQVVGGTAGSTAAGNTTTTVLLGSMIIWAKASTNITYAMAYASTGGTSMQYELHLKLEFLG